MLEIKTNPFQEIERISQCLQQTYCENDHLIDSSLVCSFSVKSQNLEILINKISDNFANYDGKLKIEANGYRSLVKVAELLRNKCVEKGQSIVSNVSKTTQVKEFLKTWSNLFNEMNNILKIGLEIMELDTKNMLYPVYPNCKAPEVLEISYKIFNLDVTPFYGEALGLHMLGDCSKFMRPLLILMSLYSDYFEGTLLQNIIKLKKGKQSYVTSREALAEKVVHLSRTMQVDFAKSFYNLGENNLVSQLKKYNPMFCTNYHHDIYYQPLEILHTDSDQKFDVPIPSAHINKDFVRIRLITNFRTRQMLGSCVCLHALVCRCKLLFAKDTIIFHVHGGGFISQTSESHLNYLQQWSDTLDVPIISIDYSLAPEAGYPRALEEVLYSYCWMLNNFEALGTTGKKIILAGDSAGGNLVTSLTLKTISNNIRKPDALVLSYAALLMQFYPSPSRLMTLMDPLLMTGIMVRCLNAYTDPNYSNTLPRTLKQELELGTMNSDMYLSPFLAEHGMLKQFPRTLFIETDIDACLDENVQFSSKLFEAGVNVQMEVLPGLPHGFQSFGHLSRDCQLGVDKVTQFIGDLIATL